MSFAWLGQVYASEKYFLTRNPTVCTYSAKTQKDVIARFDSCCHADLLSTMKFDLVPHTLRRSSSAEAFQGFVATTFHTLESMTRS